MKQSKKLEAQLLKKLGPGAERGGLILKGHKLVELTNIAEKPEEGLAPLRQKETKGPERKAEMTDGPLAGAPLPIGSAPP